MWRLSDFDFQEVEAEVAGLVFGVTVGGKVEGGEAFDLMKSTGADEAALPGDGAAVVAHNEGVAVADGGEKPTGLRVAGGENGNAGCFLPFPEPVGIVPGILFGRSGAGARQKRAKTKEFKKFATGDHWRRF